ncbi:MAG: ATP-binding protein, partial [Pseudomonadota bacterium]
PPEEAVDQPSVIRKAETVHGLRNLVQNAVDFAETTIWIDVSLSRASLRVVVGDDGAGFPEEVLQRIGDPFVTSRPRQALADRGGEEAEHQGMGLGLFIAKTLLERTGARVSFANAGKEVRRANRGAPLESRRPSGAVVAVVWPKDNIVASQRQARGALGENPRFSLDNV